MGEKTILVKTSIGEVECHEAWNYNEENYIWREGFAGGPPDCGGHPRAEVWKVPYEKSWRCGDRNDCNTEQKISELVMRVLLLKTPEEALKWMKR